MAKPNIGSSQFVYELSGKLKANYFTLNHLADENNLPIGPGRGPAAHGWLQKSH
jgi:hypothetical protein